MKNPILQNNDTEQSDTLLIEITGSVFDGTGKVEGIVRMERSEAERLINLGVAIKKDEFYFQEDAATNVDVSGDDSSTEDISQQDAPADIDIPTSDTQTTDIIQQDAPADLREDAPVTDKEIDNQVDNRVNSEVGEVIISDISNTKEKIDDKTPKQSAASRPSGKKGAVKQA